jgi:O-antigen ligase/polysaccharide polymerase Wzy-like membrane protein
MLALVSCWPSAETKYAYRGHLRWTGPCDNPNIFGLLMGVGVILVIGRMGATIRYWRICGRKDATSWMALGFWTTSGGLLLNSLVHSYSRGAWLGTAIGTLVLWWLRPREADRRRLAWRLAPIAVALPAMAVLLFWHYRPNAVVLNRVYSVVNASDFSSRNRSAAMIGALQIMGDHFWVGAGWSRPEPLYETFYSANVADGGMAIQMNSPLLLGASLGGPTLIAWLMYVATSAARALFTAVGRGYLAAAMVLMIGCIFDGALQFLPAATIFWILVEAGAAAPPPDSCRGNRRLAVDHIQQPCREF